jgi:tRNA 5-methylaminomethyl-2-thiouridine biosynthesis bifunctional protein
MYPQPLIPARLAYLADGALYSPRYEDRYASVAGGLAETQHVFLGGNGLPDRWRGCRQFVVVETGFGAGLNFLATWAAWRRSMPVGVQLHYLSVEKHPFGAHDLGRVTSAWPELASLANELRAQYPPLVPGFHRMHFDARRVVFTLMFGEAIDMLRQLDARADAFYLDGFAPAKNREMWSEDIFRELARLAQSDATVATYTVAGVVRAGLAAAGFSVERRAGFGPKREMLVARYAGRSKGEVHRMPGTEAVVIGAGLAGTSCAAQLASRGWQVQVVERRGAPAQETSGNPAGLLMPAFSVDWNPAARLTVPSFVYAVQWLNALSRREDAPVWRQSGVLQLARDQAHLERQMRILEAFALPDDLVRFAAKEEGATLCGLPVAGAGWWLRSAGWADPAAVCRANLAAGGDAVRCRFDSEVARLRRVDDGWETLDAAGALVGRASVAILANAQAARAVPGCEGLALTPIRGQLSFIPQAVGRHLSVPVCRDGFITPAVDGVCCLGASYDVVDDDPQPRESDHAANLERLERLLPGFGTGLNPAVLRGRVGFRTVTPDRLPLVGAVPLVGGQGLFACLGLASRGLTWAPLLGEILACRIAGEPLPVERDVLGWLEPGRFARRDREGQPRPDLLSPR